MQAACTQVAPMIARFVWGGLLLATLLGGHCLTVLPAETSTLDQAFVRLQTFDWNDSREALDPILRAFQSARTNANERLRLEKRLAAVLGSSAPRAAKAFVCRELSLVGTAHTVPMLARLLADPELAHPARLALERIPNPCAAESLRQALRSVEGRLQVGIINSLGNRRDPLAVPLLAGLLTSSDSDTAAAALLALGKIGTIEAAQALNAHRASPAAGLQPSATEACLMAAENLARAGQTKEADDLFRALYAAEDDSRFRSGAYRGMLICAKSPRAAELLCEAFSGSGAELCAVASDWIADRADPDLVWLLGEKLAGLRPAGQVSLLKALRVCGEKAGAGVARRALSSPVAEVRTAALRAIGNLGDSSDLPVLLRLSASPQEQERAAARFALANLPGQDVDEQLAGRLKDAGPEAVVLLQSLAARHSPGAAEATLSFLKEPGPARISALEALALLGDERQVPTLVPLVNDPETTTQAAAQRALEAIVARTRGRSFAALSNAYNAGDSATRTVLVKQFGAIAGPRALQAVRLALKDPEPAVRNAAFAALADWPGPGAAPDLLNLARTAENPSWKALAFRGFIRLCRDSDMTAEQRLEGLGEAAKLASKTEDKLLLISAWATMPRPEALKQLAACLEDPSLSEAAGLAIATAAPRLDARHKDLAVPTLQQVLETCNQTNVQERARAALRELEKKTQP